MTLIQCIYCSASSDDSFSSSDLNEILEKSRRNNSALGITGVLLYEKGSFFQVLEGEAEAVDELFQKLLLDSRHTNVAMIISEPIVERTFGAWSMAYPEITRADIEAVPGLNGFFAQDKSFLNVKESTATIFMEAFRNGEWRI